MKRYTEEQAVCDIKADLLRDAEHAEHQAAHGPYYPNVTRESLTAYAQYCRDLIARTNWSSNDFIMNRL